MYKQFDFIAFHWVNEIVKKDHCKFAENNTCIDIESVPN